MGEHPGGLDGAIRTENAEDGGRSSRGRNRANPKGASRGRLQLSIHPSQARIIRRVLAECAARRSSDGTVQVSAFGRCNRGTVCFAEANADCLAIGHANITTKAVQDIVLRTDCISLINKVDEAALLHRRRQIQLITEKYSRSLSQEVDVNSRWRRRVRTHG